jgi:hypothetical protein
VLIAAAAVAVVVVIGGVSLALRARTNAEGAAPRDARSSAGSPTARPSAPATEPASRGVPAPVVTSKHPGRASPTADPPTGRRTTPRARPTTTVPGVSPTDLPDLPDRWDDPYDGYHRDRHDPPPWWRRH